MLLFRPVFCRILCLQILGYIVAQFLDYYFPIFLSTSCLLGLLFLAVWCLESKPFHKRKFLLSNLIFAFCIFLSSLFYASSYFAHPEIPKQEIYQATLINWKQSSSGKYQLDFKVQNAESRSFKLKAFIPLMPNIEIGDKCILNTKLLKASTPKNPLDFDYKEYLARKGIYWICYLETGQIRVLNSGFSLFGIARKLQQKLASEISLWSSNKKIVALYSSLLLGNRSGMDSESMQTFRDLGVAHILAVSGLHVGIIYLLFGFLLQRLPKWTKLICILLILWLFAFISGLSASVCRASFMFSLISISSSIGRWQQSFHVLYVSAFVLLLMDPYNIFDLGFQLSHLAVFGILAFQGRFSKILQSENKILHFVWGILTVSLAAQLATFPLTVFYFKSFPVFFLISNLIILPLVSILLYSALPILLLALLPLDLTWPIFLLEKLAEFFFWVSATLSKFLVIDWSPPVLNEVDLLLLFSAILSFMALFVYGKKSSILLLLGCILAVQVNGFVKERRSLERKQLLFFSSAKGDRKLAYFYSGQVLLYQTTKENSELDLESYLNGWILQDDSLIQSNENLIQLGDRLIYQGDFKDTLGLARADVIWLPKPYYIPKEIIEILQRKPLLLDRKPSPQGLKFYQNTFPKFHALWKKSFEIDFD